MARKKRTTRRRTNTRKGMTRTTARKAYAPRRRRSNPKAGLSPADIRDLGSAAAGGLGAGLLTSYLEENKPAALAAVPTEVVGAGIGVALAMFGKTPILKNLAAGMISYSAGSWAANMAKAQMTKVPGLYSPSVGALTYGTPNNSTSAGAINVAGLTFAVEE